MRIGVNFHTSDEYISGVEYYALGLLRGFAQIDKENHYIVYTNHPGLVRQHIQPFERMRIVEVKHLRTRAARILWEHSQLPRLAARDRLDLLHCLSYICPLYKKSMPYVVTVHDTIAIDYPNWCKRTNSLYFNLFMKRAVKKASRIISLSKCTASDLKRNFNLPCSKVRVVYPGIDRIFKPGGTPSDRARIRARYNLPGKYVLYVGNIEPKKNIRTLLSLQKEIHKNGLPHKLVIVGKRSWRSKTELGWIANQVASEDTVRTGYVERNELPFVYAMAEVFVFPSLYEGFGFPPLEAMACGTPVVSSSRGALNETLRNAAMIVDPLSSKQIARAIVSMITDQCLREKHISMGLRQSSRFNWEKAAKETLSLYEEVSGLQ